MGNQFIQAKSEQSDQNDRQKVVQTLMDGFKGKVRQFGRGDKI
jgi:hypothetical protein